MREKIPKRAHMMCRFSPGQDTARIPEYLYLINDKESYLEWLSVHPLLNSSKKSFSARKEFLTKAALKKAEFFAPEGPS